MQLLSVWFSLARVSGSDLIHGSRVQPPAAAASTGPWLHRTLLLWRRLQGHSLLPRHHGVAAGSRALEQGTGDVQRVGGIARPGCLHMRQGRCALEPGSRLSFLRAFLGSPNARVVRGNPGLCLCATPPAAAGRKADPARGGLHPEVSQLSAWPGGLSGQSGDHRHAAQRVVVS